MKTLHNYLTREVLVTLVMTVAVCTFVLLLATVLKEVLGMLVSGRAPMGIIFQAVALLIPFVLVFALPMGLLTATLLVFGRFSAENELTAVRAGGVSLVALITPVLLLSVVLSGVSAIINLELAPRCRVAYNELLRNAGMAKSLTLLPEKTYIRYFKGNIVYVNKVRGTNLEDVLIYTMDEERVSSYVRADRGTLGIDSANNVLTIRLFNLHRIFFTEDRNVPQLFSSGEWEFSYTNAPTRTTRKIDASDMTFFQLREELRDLDQRLGSAIVVGKTNTAAMREKMRQIGTQKKRDMTMPIQVQMHRQVAFSFACIGFTLVGIPLGIRAHRRETTFGIAVALILVLAYYSFFVLSQALNTRPELAPHLFLWLANFLFQAVGIVLLRRANRGI